MELRGSEANSLWQYIAATMVQCTDTVSQMHSAAVNTRLCVDDLCSSQSVYISCGGCVFDQDGNYYKLSELHCAEIELRIVRRFFSDYSYRLSKCVCGQNPKITNSPAEASGTNHFVVHKKE